MKGKRGIGFLRTLQNCSKFSKRSLKERNLAVSEAANFAKRFIQTSLLRRFLFVSLIVIVFLLFFIVLYSFYYLDDWKLNNLNNFFSKREGIVDNLNNNLWKKGLVQLAAVCSDSDGDFFNQSGVGCGVVDCDDSNNDVYPDAGELCDGIENQCYGDSGFWKVDDGCTSEEVVFAVIGDFGSGSQAEGDVANLVKSWNPDFIITTGDNNYDSGAASTIDANIGQFYHDFIFNYSGGYGNGSIRPRFFPSLGNHDWVTAGAQPYLNYFALPGNERYYDFVWGNVHFFVVDSDANEPDGTSSTSIQGQWLQNALSSATEKFKVVYFHHASYSSSSTHGSSVWMQWPFQQWGADVVMSGHDHTYERILVSGFPYFVNGLGGKSIYNFGAPISGSMVRYNGNYGAMRVRVNSTHVVLDFVNRAGLLVDSYTTELNAICGDSVIDSGEACDDGDLNGRPSYCNNQCSGYTSIITQSISYTPVKIASHSVTEASGVVASRVYNNVYWMIGDSDQPANIVAVNNLGTTLGIFSVTGSSNRDWEDIALDENNNIWVAETGDNSQVHPDYSYYVVPEPNPFGGGGPTASVVRYRFVYSDGKKDSEGTFIWQNLPYIVQKRPTNAKVYKINSLDSSQTVTALPIGEFANNDNWITGADISRDGRRLALINDGANDYHWIIERNHKSTNISDFFTRPMNIWRIQFSNEQGEAITFVNDSYDFIVVSEQFSMWRVNQSNYDSVSACSDGEINSMCKCGRGNYVEGYCCSGAWQENSCGTCVDNDGDGFNVTGGQCGIIDCDDNNSSVYQNAPELCDNIDNQCPGDVGYGSIDEGCPQPSAPLVIYGNLTPANGTSQNERSVVVDASIIGESVGEIKFNWNSTNFSFYNPSLVLMMNFDNRIVLGESASLVKDLSASGYDGIPVGGAVFSDLGKYGGAFMFDGASGYIDLSEPANLKLYNFTLMAWFYRTGNGIQVNTGGGGIADGIPIVTKGRGEADGDNRDMNYFLGISDTNDVVAADFESNEAVNNNYPVFGKTKIMNNGWYFVAASYNGSTWSLYLNGELENTSVVNKIPRGDSIQDNAIGSALDSVGNPVGYFQGYIDEVRILNKALSSDDIREIYFGNLQKLNQTNWYIYINQSLNSSSGLGNGVYTYFVSSANKFGLESVFEMRTIIIGGGSVCGNGNLENGEECEVGDQQGCLIGGYNGLRNCNLSCTGWQECVAIEWCGDGTCQEPGPESCLNCANDCGVCPDLTAPVISFVVNSTITNDSARISWQTDENANSTVEFGLDINFGLRADNASYLLSHLIQLNDLLSNKTYYYRVESCDLSGNCANSSTYSFKTLNIDESYVDNEGPVILLGSPSNGSSIASNSVTFVYAPSDYSNISNCSLIIGVETRIDSEIENGLDNLFVLNLENGDYLWNVSCIDEFGNLGESFNWDLNVNYFAPSGGNNNGGGGGGGGISKPEPKAELINNTNKSVLIGEDINKIEIGDEVAFIDVNLEERVIVDVDGEGYDVSFKIVDEGVIVKLANGEFLIPKNDILTVLMGNKEVYIGVTDIENKKVVLGLDKEAVKSEVEIDGGEKSGIDGTNLVGYRWKTILIIILALLVAIGVLLLIVYRLILKRKGR